MLVARPSVFALMLALVTACGAPVDDAGGPRGAGSPASGGGGGSSLPGGGAGGSAGGLAGAGGTPAVGGNSGTGGNAGAAGGAGMAGGGGQGTEPPAPVAELTVLTFNVRTQDADSVDAPLGNDWAKRLPLVLEVLNDRAPDVVGLQEAKESQVSAISAGFEVLEAPGVAILYRTSRLAALEGGVVNVGNYGNMDPWGERWCNWQRFEIIGSGAEFVFFNTHLSTAGDNVPQSEFVLEQAAGWVEQGLPVIVTGDFNYDAAATIAARGFVDGVSDHGGTFHAFGGGRSGPRLDFIAIQGADALASGVDTRSDAEQDPIVYPSDHYPVWATLAL